MAFILRVTHLICIRSDDWFIRSSTRNCLILDAKLGEKSIQYSNTLLPFTYSIRSTTGNLPILMKMCLMLGHVFFVIPFHSECKA